MLRAMLRDLRAHPGRIAMTLVAIVLGVGFVVATWVVSDSAARGAAGAPSRTDVDVAVQAPSREARISRRRPGPAGRAARRRRGPAGVSPAHAALVGATASSAGVWPDRRAPTGTPSQRFTLTDGRGPERADEVALGAGRAAEAGLAVGDSARVLLGDGASRRFTVVGLFSYRALGAEPAPSLAFDDDAGPASATGSTAWNWSPRPARSRRRSRRGRRRHRR